MHISGHCWRAYFFSPVFKYRSYFPAIIFPRHNSGAERRSNEIARFLSSFLSLSSLPLLFINPFPTECRGPSRALFYNFRLSRRSRCTPPPLPPVLVFKRPRAKDYLILLYSLTKLRGTTSVPSSTVLSFASRPTRRVLGKRGKERGEANVVRTNPRKGLERARRRNSTIFRDFLLVERSALLPHPTTFNLLESRPTTMRQHGI